MASFASADHWRLGKSRLATVISWWYDRGSDNRALWIFLVLFVAVWTIFQVIAHWKVGVHKDLAEVFLWSRHPAASYQIHPPLAGLIGSLWFFIFPPANWSFYLLAMVNSAVALFGVDLIARRYVAGDKRLLVLLLLLLTPFYQFHAARFTPNQILLSTWPLATYCFLRAFESRTIGWSALAGVTAALAMLGKYYSIYLIAGLIVAALVDQRRWPYLRSPAPWISIAAGLAVLAPHLYWLARNGPGPFEYALTGHGAPSVADALWKASAYAIGGIAYVLLPVAVYLIAVNPLLRLLKAAFWPADPNRRMLVVLLTVPLLLPMLTAPVIGVELTPLWTMSAWFLLPIVLLAPPEANPSRPAAVGVAIGVVLLTAVVLTASPVLAWRNFIVGCKSEVAYSPLFGRELTQIWREVTGRALTIVASDEVAVARGVAFYSPDHPDATAFFGSPYAPWVTKDRAETEGWAGICFAEDQFCADRLVRQSANRTRVLRVERTLIVSFFGRSSTARKFLFVVVP